MHQGNSRVSNRHTNYSTMYNKVHKQTFNGTAIYSFSNGVANGHKHENTQQTSDHRHLHF